MSDTLASQGASAEVAQQYSQLTFAADDPTLNVFRVAADTLGQVTGIVVSAPSESAVLIDVVGSSVSIGSMQITLQGVGKTSLLWNMSEATQLSLASVALPGSVLAPRAFASVNNGNFEGTLVAHSVQGSMEFHHFPLTDSDVFGGSSVSTDLRFSVGGRLRAGCEYFLLVDQFPANSEGSCLAEPFLQSFLVQDSRKSAFDREVAARKFRHDTEVPVAFTAREGINTRLEDVFPRYETTLKMRRGLDSLVVSGSSVPSPFRPGESLLRVRQYFKGIPISGAGYLVHHDSGLFRSAVGHVVPNVDVEVDPSISEGQAAMSRRLLIIAQAAVSLGV